MSNAKSATVPETVDSEFVKAVLQRYAAGLIEESARLQNEDEAEVGFTAAGAKVLADVLALAEKL